MKPHLSTHFQSRMPSAIRMAQIEFFKRTDQVEAVNTAIGNVSLPMHPAMQQRMRNLGAKISPFKNGVVKYSATVGFEETNQAFLNIIASSGFSTKGLYSQVTDGGSQAMELVIIGTCGQAGSFDRPLMLIDAAYTNYNAMAKRTGRATVSVSRTLQKDGRFTLPNMDEIEQAIQEQNPAALVVIPYDNPAGHFYSQQDLNKLGKLCVKHNMWLVSDEAYRELFYTDDKVSSVWGITEKAVPGITGRRISIETASKVWNACGLRVGAIVTDNQEFHQKSVAENTASLCTNVIGQYIFGVLAHEPHQDLQQWYRQQRQYYRQTMETVSQDLKKQLPKLIVSRPDASIYSVIDVKQLVEDGFDASDFVMYCAREGKVTVDGKDMTLLVAPMAGFYTSQKDSRNPGLTQMRIAYVEVPHKMKHVPKLFADLLEQYLQKTINKT